MIREPVVREADSASGEHALVADLAIRGAWIPQEEALFDIQVMDTDAESYCTLAPGEVLRQTEVEKKRKYRSACEERRASFTPLCMSVDGLLACEAHHFVKAVGWQLALKWETSYSQVVGWVRARLSFAILRASILCLRGSRTRWRGIGLEDGAPLVWLWP